MQAKSIIQQNIERFEEEHGGRKVAVLSLDEGWWLYPDGARRESNPNGALIWPKVTYHPYHGNQEAYDWDILNCRIEYYETKVARRVAAFNQQRERMTNRDYSDSEFQELERLMDLVDIAKNELADVEAEKRKHPAYIREQKAREFAAESAERIKEKNHKLSKMRI